MNCTHEVNQFCEVTMSTEKRCSSTGPVEDGLRVAYLNVNGARNKRDQIEYLIKRYDLDIFFVAESKLWKTKKKETTKIPNSQMNIKGYHMKRLDREKENKKTGGGILAYICFDYKDNCKVEAINGGIGDTHSLQYIDIQIPSLKVRFIGAYVSKEEHENLIRLFDKPEFQNAIIMGDMNRCLYKTKDEFPHALIKDKGLTQHIKNYTRVAATISGMSETCMDHIYSHDASNSDVLIKETGVVHCGISDHALIYCTTRPKKNCSWPIRRTNFGDLLQHDVPILMAALITDGSDVISKMLETSTEFWVMARRMETRRILLSEQIKTADKLKIQVMLKDPVNFCTEMSRQAERHCSFSLLTMLHQVKRVEIQGLQGATSIINELDWYLNVGIRCNKMSENIFLSNRTKYLNFCFPELETPLLSPDFRVINPQTLRLNDELSSLDERMTYLRDHAGVGESVFVVRYKRNKIDSDEFISWCGEFSAAEARYSFGFKQMDSLFGRSQPTNNHLLPLGISEFTNLLYHKYVLNKLNMLFTDLGNIIGHEYNGDTEGFIHVKIYHTGEEEKDAQTRHVVHKTLSAMINSKIVCASDPIEWTLLGKNDMPNRIQAVRIHFRSRYPTGKFRSKENIIEAECSPSEDIQRVISAFIEKSSGCKVEQRVISRWLNLPRTQIEQRGEDVDFPDEFDKELCSVCEECDSWSKLNDQVHEGNDTKHCLQSWLKVIESSIINGTMFLSNKMGYFNLHVLPDLLGGYWNNRKIINPRDFWTWRNTVPNVTGSACLFIRYELSDEWHQGDDKMFWEQETIWDEHHFNGSWSNFVNKRGDTPPDGMEKFDNIICHRHLKYKLKSTLDLYKGDIRFTDRFNGLIYFYIPCRDGNVDKASVTSTIELIIDTIRQDKRGIEKELEYSVSNNGLDVPAAFNFIDDIMDKYEKVLKSK